MLHWIDLLTGYIGQTRRTVLVLVAVNLMPLVLVAAGWWSLQQVILLYWIENGVIGLWNMVKMLYSGSPPFPRRLSLAIFFFVHFGGFFVVHGVFVMFFLKLPISIHQGLLQSMWNALPGGLWPMVLALVCSHGYSAFRYHFSHDVWRSANAQKLLMKPYGRVILLHLALLGSGFLISRHGETVSLLVLLVVLKIILDVVLHVRAHRRKVNEPYAWNHAV